MTSYVNPLADMCHAQLEASRRFADVLFAGTERIDHVVIEASHRAFTEQVNLAHAALSMRDPKELASIQSSLAAHRPDSAINLQKEVVRVFAEMQNEMGRSVKDCIEKFGTSFARSATAPIRNVQERAGDAAFNPMGGMFSVWESMMREMATLASKNIATARSSYEHLAEEVTHATVQAGSVAAQQAAEAAQAMASHAGQAMENEAARNHLNSGQGNGQGNGHAAPSATSTSEPEAAAASPAAAVAGSASPQSAAASTQDSEGGEPDSGPRAERTDRTEEKEKRGASQASHATHHASGSTSRRK